MILFYLTIPFMLLGLAIAVLPVLVGSFRNQRSIREGQIDTPETRAHEANFWHHVLGHRSVQDFGPTPDTVDDEEVLRVAPADRLVSKEPTVWAFKELVSSGKR